MTPSDALPNCDMLGYTDQVTDRPRFFLYTMNVITIHPFRLALLFGVISLVVAILSLLSTPFVLLSDLYVGIGLLHILFIVFELQGS